MSETSEQTLQDVLAFLRGLVRDRVAPEPALRRLTSLRERHPATSIELVWEDQAFDGSVHYDALISPPGGRTISLSVCADTALPWPLRGLQRWRDSDLLRVNGVALPVASAIAQLDLLWEKKSLMQRLVDSCLIEQALRSSSVEVDDDDVQMALDAMRRGRGLYTIADTEAWMKSSGLTWQALEETAIQLARAAKLRDRIAGNRVDSYFVEHRASFDTVALAIVLVPSQRLAAEFVETVRAGRATLLDAAQRSFRASGAEKQQPILRKALRFQLSAELGCPALAEVTASDEKVIGPLAMPNGFLVAEVLAVERAKLDDRVRAAVKARIFEDWLAEQRRAARIEWFWGKVEQTQVEAAQALAA